MHYKVPAITLYVNEHTTGFRLRRVNGNPHGVVVETAAGDRVELPPMPRTAQDGLAAELVAAGLAGDALADSPEAEGAAVVRAAISDSAQLTADRDDADLAPLEAGDHMAVALEIGDRADVLPGTHARARPSRSP
jgi:hypothetical protein